MDIKAINFSYDTEAVSEDQFNAHIKLYEGYIEKTNEISRKLETNAERQSANATYSHYRGLKKGQTYALNGVILHEEYFKNMSRETTGPGQAATGVFDRTYGGYTAFLDDFTACAKAARGWCVFAYDSRTESFSTILQDSHDDGVVTLSYPVIVLDMYEHAYFLDYKTDKAAYINKFIQSINWKIVEERLKMLL